MESKGHTDDLEKEGTSKAQNAQQHVGINALLGRAQPARKQGNLESRKITHLTFPRGCVAN